jgi:rhamnosyltransferase
MQQTVQPTSILIIDSSSTDNTINLLSSYPIQLHIIPKQEFDHGKTRKLATRLVDADIYIYLTQDAYPANKNTFKALLSLLLANEKNKKMACAYGRQLPKKNATPLGKHARLYHYPAIGAIRHYADRQRYGIKTCFNSNSFAAYKKTYLDEVGNFPERLIAGEDVYIAAKLLIQGYSIGYADEACVFHSHNLTLREEFHRYFSIGVFHGKESWILNSFKSAQREGLRFIVSEWRFLLKEKEYVWLPYAILSTCVKFIAYHLGLHEHKIPYFIKKKMGINKSFWLPKKAVME